MDKPTFGREMARAKTMQEIGDNQDYWAGYQRGLRRAHHGESFGTDDEHQQWLALLNEDDPQRQARGCGYRDGLIGSSNCEEV